MDQWKSGSVTSWLIPHPINKIRVLDCWISIQYHGVCNIGTQETKNKPSKQPRQPLSSDCTYYWLFSVFFFFLSARVGACGGNYSSPSGVIYSPDFPDKYGAGRVCYWTVQVPGSSAILFNFTFFDISDQTDMVELLDGYTNQVVARFDWRSPPRELVNVTGDFVIVYFYSDRTNQAQGFALLYQGGTSLAW